MPAKNVERLVNNENSRTEPNKLQHVVDVKPGVSIMEAGVRHNATDTDGFRWGSSLYKTRISYGGSNETVD